MNIQNFVTNELTTLLFYLAACATLPCAFGVIFDQKVIRAGFLLIGVFGGISLLFLLLQAQFLAMAQMMIYAVGITLVVVIALMLTNPRMEEDTTSALPSQKLPGLFISTILFITLYLGIRSESWTGPTTSQGYITNEDISRIGVQLLKDYSLPFEFASILLLVALMGAVLLAKHDRSSESEDLPEIDLEAIEEKDDVVVKA